MKIRFTLLVVAFGIFSIMSCANNDGGGPVSAKGNEGLNGGDHVALEFTNVAQNLVAILSTSGATQFPEVSLASYKSALAKTRVIVRNHTYANGTETDASNNGQDLIEVNASRWTASAQEPIKRQFIVFHEYLGIMGLEKDNYYISSRLLDKRRYLVDGRWYKPPVGDCRQFKVHVDATTTNIILEIDPENCWSGTFVQQINLLKKVGDEYLSSNCPQPKEASCLDIESISEQGFILKRVEPNTYPSTSEQFYSLSDVPPKH